MSASCAFNAFRFIGVDMEILPCPKCGKAPYPYERSLTQFEARIACTCNLRTKTFVAAKIPWTCPEDGDTNDDIRRRVCVQAIEAWNAGRFSRTVMDVHLDAFALGVMGEMIQDYLETQEGLSPAERVKGWDALKSKWRECGHFVKKEIEYDGTENDL